MSAHCQVTGAQPGFGHRISHSHRRTKRRFDPSIETIHRRGIDAVVRDILARGETL